MFPRPLPRSRVIWPTAIAALAALDMWCDRGEPDSDTLSEFLREVFAVDTPAGKAAFTLALTVGANWLHNHILKEIG